MYGPSDTLRRTAAIDTQLEELAGPQPSRRDGHDPHRSRLCKQAAAFLLDEGYADLVAHLRHVACSTPEEAPGLGTLPDAAMTEYVLFRAGATQMFRMIGRLAMEAHDELVD